MMENPQNPALHMTPATPGPLLIQPHELLRGALHAAPFSAPLADWLARLLGIHGVNELYAAVAHQPAGIAFAEALLAELKITLRVREEDLRHIPAQGALLAVANHPYGALEGIVLALLLQRVRSRVRLMANSLLQRIPQLKETVIPVDPFGGPGALQRNLGGMRESLAWLRGGGALGVFPAGEVSHWQPRERRVADPAWNPNVAGLARRANAAVLPVYFDGANGLSFQLAGLLHPRARTAQLGNQLLRVRNRVLEVRIGHAVSAESLRAFPDDESCIQALRQRVYLMANREAAPVPLKAMSLVPLRLPTRLAPQPLAAPVLKETLRTEIETLAPDALLCSQGEFDVFVMSGNECPAVLLELGRLREESFRAVGEGTGRSLDLDRFDKHYLHLFVWNRERAEIAGAYRLAFVADVLRQRGVEHLYLSTLFRMQPAFFRRLGPALELGRSFVQTSYQRSPAPLMLLWKGIGTIVARTPSCTRLLGPVSISNAYTPCSRRILVDFLEAHAMEQELRAYVQPLHPFPRRRIPAWDHSLAHCLLREVEDVTRLLSEIEPDGKGMPVLLRQYLRLGGRILAFNVDPQFANVLDGLILVDLLQTDPKVLARYMGKEGAEAFLAARRGNPLVA